MVANQRKDFQQIDKSEGIFELRMRVKTKCTFAIVRFAFFFRWKTHSLLCFSLNGHHITVRFRNECLIPIEIQPNDIRYVLFLLKFFSNWSVYNSCLLRMCFYLCDLRIKSKKERKISCTTPLFFSFRCPTLVCILMNCLHKD